MGAKSREQSVADPPVFSQGLLLCTMKTGTSPGKVVSQTAQLSFPPWLLVVETYDKEWLRSPSNGQVGGKNALV